jgi:hypothetical protein
MTPEQQKIVIAKACGWVEGDPRFEYNVMSRIWWKYGSYYRYDDLPDYLNDLNAMHEAYRSLNINQKTKFVEVLADTMLDYQCMDFTVNPFMCAELCNANAAQRAEAFLKTLNLLPD